MSNSCPMEIAMCWLRHLNHKLTFIPNPCKLNGKKRLIYNQLPTISIYPCFTTFGVSFLSIPADIDRLTSSCPVSFILLFIYFNLTMMITVYAGFITSLSFVVLIQLEDTKFPKC